MNFAYTNAELTARRVLEECGLTDSTELPLAEIILGRRAFYDEQPLIGKEGEIVSVKGKSIITINSTIAFETKKRFAAAHELGHYEMHKDLHPVFSDTEEDLLSWYKGGPHEMEANEFAAEFLMPSEVFYNECKGKKFGPEVIEHLSKRFQISKTAAILRFAKRGNHPVMIVYCKDNKMKWWKKSDDFYHFLLFSHDSPPPSGSVAYELFSSGTSYKGEEQKQQVWKGDWFQLKDNEKESPFFEYCLFAKTYNYSISILWEK